MFKLLVLGALLATCMGGSLSRQKRATAGWSGWTDWGPCSERCGKGHQQRSRVCRDYSRGCDGSELDTRLCVCVAPVPNDCARCSAEHLYMSDPCDCGKFYQCSKDISGGWNMHHQNCGACTEWDYEDYTCGIHIENCHSPAVQNDDEVSHGLYTCIRSGDANWQRHPSDDKKYQWLVHGRWLAMPCAPGTVFSLGDCGCIHDPNYSPTNAPKEITSLEFQTNVAGSRGIWIKNAGVTIVSGKAFFNGYGYIEIPYFNNRYNYKSFAVSVWYRRIGVETGGQVILTNGDCETSSSIEIKSESRDRISASIKTVGGPATVGQLPVVFNQWHHVALVYTGVRFVTYVDGTFHSSVQQVDGLIEQRKCNLRVGSGQLGTGFTGYMDKLSLYANAIDDSTVQAAFTAGHD